MFNKIVKYIRKAHRYLTPLFAIVTILAMLVFKDIVILANIQKILMLTMAITGVIIFIHIYVNKYKSKQRQAAKNKA